VDAPAARVLFSADMHHRDAVEDLSRGVAKNAHP
jgi:hypothetical protein